MQGFTIMKTSYNLFTLTVRRGFLIETDCVLSYLSQAVKLNIFHLILQTIALLSRRFSYQGTSPSTRAQLLS